jgi:hypothetical protein
MPDGHDEDKEDVVVDLVDDAIVAGSYPPLALPSASFLAPLGRG